MKTSNFWQVISLLLTSIPAMAQNPFRIKVIDNASGNNIAGANVYIDQVPSSDRWTDANGVVAYNNIPDDRKVIIHIKKEGYKIITTEALASPAALPDNNITVKLERESILTTILIWGTLEDQAGNNVSKANVSLNFLDQTMQAVTDNSGIYRFKIPKENFDNVKTYTIEAKVPNCKVIKANESYYGGFFENKSYKFLCTLDGESGVKEAQDYGNINLIGSWACELYEQGVKTTILISLQSGGALTYHWYTDGKYNSTNTDVWKYYDKYLIEADNNKLVISKISWNSIDDFYLTIVDNGHDEYRGEKRHYVRVK